ncbi:helix-turn-helix transcriptional regulator [Qingshengfaniella alkalisoli]|uniref:LuxR family transcriptional regulator n=1 Tax=Qingshengfaniella alkalisoli TaxID=2599296 RepID=A0A5B8I7A1_9RHOB|nr:autoinducer binding domain-containing protein [Qingshengfaniella alkalisoli]QDY68406.1 LuxR family transcriptional regulator [Qingshengfaniella alkalisoli]
MAGRIERFVTLLQQVTTPEGLQPVIHELREQLQADHVVFHSIGKGGRQFAALTYETDWVDRYLEMGYARIDPVVQGCFQRFQPVDWKALDWSTKASRSFLHEALEAGIGNQGLSLPVRGPGGQFALFTVNSRTTDDSWQRYCDTHLNDLILAAHLLNQRVLELSSPEAMPRMHHLSPREVDTLSLLAIGRSRAQAADALSISEHTLRAYIEAARFKLGAQNTTHAVAKAMSMGLLVL